MKFALQFIFAMIMSAFISTGFVGADTKPPAEGSVLPQINLMVPENLEHQQYLGVTGKKSFAIPEITAEVVIIEIFSMY